MKKQGSFLKGTIWTTLSFIVVSVIYILRISVLTRYLDKSDFGLVAIVLFVLGFTNVFADLGVSVSLLSQEKIEKREYSSLYWGGVGLSIILYFMIVGLTPVFSFFYKQEILRILIPIMGVDLIISSLGRQFAVFKQKKLRFKQLAIIKIVSETLSMVVAIVLAVYGFGIWSLILSLLTTSTINSLLNIILGYKSYPLMWYFNYKETKHLYKIGFYQTGSQVLDYLSSQIDILILGKLLPMTEMGVYSIIKSLVLRVYISINKIITKVAIPVFAKLYSDLKLFKSRYLNVVSTVTMINTFIYFNISFCSREVLEIFYGEDYVQYDYILMILCVWGLFSSIINCSASIVVISTGRTDLGFKWTQFRLLLNPIFIITGALAGGVFGVAISQAVYAIIGVFFYRSIVIKKVVESLTSLKLLQSIYKPLIASLINFPFLFFIDKWLAFINNSYLSIALNTIFAAFIFCFFLRKEIKTLIKVLK
ncbi:MAG: MOP flippase family protein [Tenacibaculum sp.]